MRRKAKRRFPLIEIICIALIIGTLIAWKNGNGNSETPNAAKSKTEPAAVNRSDPEPTKKENSSNKSRGVVPVRISEITDTRCLQLINHDYAISGEPDDELIMPAWPDVPVSTREVMLHKTTVEAVGELFAAAREADAGTFYVSSGYRDYAGQKQSYDDAPDKSYAQPPNHSEHQSGFAADILAIGVLQAEMGASDEGQWLAENAWKYGLILRYPPGKQDITGIAYEPWHFRYIDHPHALYCHQNTLCFEEYVRFLKDSGGYRAKHGGKTYTVLYQTPQDGIIYVPESRSYCVSGDNTGGYIITAWE